MTDAAPAPALLTLRQACGRLALSERTLRDMIAWGKVEVVKPDGMHETATMSRTRREKSRHESRH